MQDRGLQSCSLLATGVKRNGSGPGAERMPVAPVGLWRAGDKSRAEYTALMGLLVRGVQATTRSRPRPTRRRSESITLDSQKRALKCGARWKADASSVTTDHDEIFDIDPGCVLAENHATAWISLLFLLPLTFLETLFFFWSRQMMGWMDAIM
jgi:hypothetical protein